jgi:hypothetical protein
MVDCANKAYHRFTTLLRLDPMFDWLRNDPRFQKLVISP